LKAFSTSLLAIFFSINIFAQNAPATFVTRTANFGKVKEDVGKIRYDFIYFNKGENPLKIEKVVPSCGCTATEFTQMAIPQDSSGKIRVTYNTTNRPGEINKTVSVYFVGYESPIILYLKGIVVGTQRLIERELVYPFGNLRFQSMTLNLGTVRTNEPTKKMFEFYNAGKKEIQINETKFDTSFLKLSLNKKNIKPKEVVKITVIYDAVARRNWGFQMDTIQLLTNDDSLSIKTIPVTAHIEEYFPPMDAAKLAKAPKIKFEKTEIFMGAVKEGSNVSFNYKFVNEGKEDLLIRKIVPACTCITFETPKYFVAPGESSSIRIFLNTIGREGIQNKHLTIISNAPSSPSVNLWIRANVVK